MAGLIPPSTLDQIRNANDIVDVIGSYFPLKSSGAGFVALCPFHKEKSPSFNVNPQRQIFHCFGCHKGGDVFSFVREYEGLSFMETVKRLADRAGIPLEFEDQPGQREARHLKDQLLEVHEQITRRWQTALTHDAGGQAARDYLKQRGVADTTLETFRLGYAPEAWDDTVNWAKSKDLDLGLVEKAGLILRKEGTDRYYDRFRGRLIFPICDEQGRIIGFSGRLLQHDAKAAKYVNSPETPIFHKSRVFFGLDKSKRAILDVSQVILCEGQLDMMACYTSGIRNVVAPQGTAFTSDHARILKRYAEEVILCFDADHAGQAAIVRAREHLFQAGLTMRVAVLPGKHDPDSFIQEHGADAFQELISKAQDFFDYYLLHLVSSHGVDSDKGRLAILNHMAQAVLQTGNQVLIDTHIQKTAHRLGVTTESVWAEFKKHNLKSNRRYTQNSNDPPVEPASDETPYSPPDAAEFWLVKILILQEDLVDLVARHLDVNWLKSLLVRRIVQAWLQAHQNQTWNGLPAFLNQLDDPPCQRLLTEAASEKRELKNPEKVLMGEDGRQGILEILRNDFVQRELKALQIEARHPDLTAERIHAMEARKKELRQLKAEPLLAGNPQV